MADFPLAAGILHVWQLELRCWQFTAYVMLQSPLTFLWKICASVICSIHCLCSFHMRLPYIFYLGMEKILLDSLYGEVQNATKGLPLTLRENLCLDAWCFSLNTNRCFVLFLYTQKMFGWVKIGGDSHQAISGIACSLCTLNQDSLKNKIKSHFFFLFLWLHDNHPRFTEQRNTMIGLLSLWITATLLFFDLLLFFKWV